MCVIRLSAWRYIGIYTRWKSRIISPVFCPQTHFNPVNGKYIIQFHKMRLWAFYFFGYYHLIRYWYILSDSVIHKMILPDFLFPCNMPDCPIYAFCMIYDIFIIWNEFRYYRAFYVILQGYGNYWYESLDTIRVIVLLL